MTREDPAKLSGWNSFRQSAHDIAAAAGNGDSRAYFREYA
jgi:hypothetical protein